MRARHCFSEYTTVLPGYTTVLPGYLAVSLGYPTVGRVISCKGACRSVFSAELRGLAQDRHFWHGHPSSGDTGWAMSQENVEVARRVIDAYNRRDFEAIRALNHPDVELDWSASVGLEPGIYRGQETVIRFFENFVGTFERVTLEPERFIESGDLVVVPNSAQLRGRDGIETVTRSALVFEISGGRVARICLYQGTRDALEAVGLRE